MSATTKTEKCSVGIARRRLSARGLEPVPGGRNGKFEIWIWPDLMPEMLPYADDRCEEVLVEIVEEILNRK